jgi:cation transport ATPase
MAGTGRGAELGILFKGGEVFETAHAADIVLLDKTGDGDRGAMRLAEVVPLAGFAEGRRPGLGGRRGVRLRASAGACGDRRRPRALDDIPSPTSVRSSRGAGASARVAGPRDRRGRPEHLRTISTRRSTPLWAGPDHVSSYGVTAT